MKRTRVVLATTAAALTIAGTAWAAFEPEAGSPYPTGDAPLSLYTADFNNDQRPDVAVLNGSASTIDFYLRQPGGGFAREGGAGVRVADGPSQAVPADFNGDGLTDLAVSGYIFGNVSVLIRQPSGGFVSESPGPQIGDNAAAIGAGNFDADAKTDLVVANYARGYVQIFSRNAGNNGFTAGVTAQTGANPGHLAVSDFDGDGLADIAVANFGGASVTVLHQTTDHTFQPEGAALTTGGAPANVVAADFNRDGRLDLAVSNSQASSVSVFLRRGDNTGFAEEAGSPITVDRGPFELAVADFDADGYPDVAAAASGATAVDVLRRNPAGGFTADPPIPAAASTQAVTAGDYASDGRPDIGYATTGTDQLYILANPAPVQPPPPTPTTTPVPTPTPVPSPVAGKNVNATPVSGKVKVKLPGKKTYTNLTGEQQLPVGTSVDARDGRITIVAAGKGGKADFYDGIFKISQTKGTKPLTTLTLTEKLSCPKAKKASAAVKKKKSRRLWGSGKGSFRTAGRYSAATIRGTRWLVTDRCTSTTTKVAAGVVSVRDKVKHRTKIVRKGHSYTARRRR